MLLGFFRDTSNIVRRFKCNLSYYDAFGFCYEPIDGYIPLYLLKYEDRDVREIIFEVILPTVSQTFFFLNTIL